MIFKFRAYSIFKIAARCETIENELDLKSFLSRC